MVLSLGGAECCGAVCIQDLVGGMSMGGGGGEWSDQGVGTTMASQGLRSW